MNIFPNATMSLFGGKVALTVYGAPTNWNYAGDSPEDMEAKNPGITALVAGVMEDCGVVRALVPKPAFNAQVATLDELTVELLPGFFRGVAADGVVLGDSGEAYLLASADCHTVIMYDPETHVALALHCGRDALMDRGRMNGKEPRQHESVIDTAVAKFRALGVDNLSRLKVFIAAGIGPDGFDHPTTETVLMNGEEQPNKWKVPNRAMISDLQSRYDYLGECPFPSVVTDVRLGNIDLTALIARQLDVYGIPVDLKTDWDGIDTRTDPKYHSNRTDRTMRNLVAVKLA